MIVFLPVVMKWFFQTAAAIVNSTVASVLHSGGSVPWSPRVFCTPQWEHTVPAARTIDIRFGLKVQYVIFWSV
jgi:hypothetical protein